MSTKNRAAKTKSRVNLENAVKFQIEQAFQLLDEHDQEEVLMKLAVSSHKSRSPALPNGRVCDVS